jgi:serine/threonine protein kinase
VPRTEGDAQELQRIGRFLLIDRISSGGMAEVWRARVTGIRGFTKTVAIKRIHPHLLERRRFLRMFSDEAKIASRLSHPNIVQIYDLGDEGGLPYIAMEYVAGRDLFQVMQRLADLGSRMPWPLAVRVALDTLAGLHHAHEFRSFDGLPQEIVHRDVSPRNVLVSWTGEVKLTDFGVARARDREEHTEHGVIKGKVRYLSPEAAAGSPVDRRSDLFSLGVVLAEMLTMAPLREGPNDLAVLVAIREGRLDTSRFGILPVGLRRVLERALTGNPDERYADAQAFRDDLLSEATGECLPMEVDESGAFMHALHADDIARDEDRELEVERLLAVEAARRSDPKTGSGHHPLNVVTDAMSRGRPGPMMVVADPPPEPTASGDLRTTSLTRLFHDIATTHALTELRLLRPPIVKSVFFEDGHPVFVLSNLEGELFGEHLVAGGDLSRHQHADILNHAARHGTRFTEAVLALDIMPPHQLFRLLADQVRERILEMFSWTGGRFERFDGQAAPEQGMPLNLRSHALIHEGIQDRAPVVLIRRRIEPYRDAHIILSSDELPSDLQLSGRQQRILRTLDATPSTVSELVRVEHEEERVFRLLYILAEIGRVRFTPAT